MEDHEWQFQAVAYVDNAHNRVTMFRHCKQCGRVEYRIDRMPWAPWSADEPGECADTFQVDRGKGG